MKKYSLLTLLVHKNKLQNKIQTLMLKRKHVFVYVRVHTCAKVCGVQRTSIVISWVALTFLGSGFLLDNMIFYWRRTSQVGRTSG